MFSTTLSRVTNRASCAAAAAAATANSSSTAVGRTTSCFATRRSHQRRHSSSKASCPPDSSPSSGKPAPAAKSSDAAEDKAPISDPVSQQRGAKRLTRPRKPRALVGRNKADDQFAGLPAVPGTQHLQYNDLAVSSFFSLHRPLSLSTTIPPPITNDTFENIFETRKEVDAWENGNSAERRPEDVVYALSNLFESMDVNAGESSDDGVRWEVIQESQSNHGAIKHLDGPPRQKNLDELIATFKPFRTPPPPQPFPEEPKASEKKRAMSKLKQKSYEARITVTEYTGPNGQTIYHASSSPIIPIETPEEVASISEPGVEERQPRHPFRERMLERERGSLVRIERKMQDQRSTRRIKMMLISVKRQRKLKMKKHKYKKLMKRTRNLRRRQDRA